MTSPLDIKENDERALELFTCLALFCLGEVRLSLPSTAHAFFPEHSYNHCQSLLLTFKICTKFGAHLLSDPS
jgi:hypothetical protein